MHEYILGIKCKEFKQMVDFEHKVHSEYFLKIQINLVKKDARAFFSLHKLNLKM